jgi:hypothetical protein
MVNEQVPEKITPVSEPELVAAFISAAKQMFNVELTKPQVAVLVAHVNLETGSSGANWSGGGVGNTSMHNYNIGNIQWTPNSGLDYFSGGDRTKDAKGNWVPTHFKFRAYPTLEDGVKDYLRNIHSRGNGKVWNAILQGDPSAFSQELKNTRYYEEDESKYEAAMNARLKNFNKGQSYEAALSGNVAPQKRDLDSILNQFLSALSSDESHYLKKKANKQLLPHQYLLKIKSDYKTSIKIANLLRTAIDQMLYEDASIHTNNQTVEIQTTIHGDTHLCTAALVELSSALASTFDVKVEIHPNQQSNKQELTINAALKHYDLIRTS